jgi:hypothetical protein
MEPATGLEEEPAFSDVLNDSSDVPTAVVKSHIISASQTITTGFAVHEDGSLHCSSAVEDTNFDPKEDLARDPVPVVDSVLGRGHRTKRRRRLFGDQPNWE